ncbi:MAG: biotin--[acetyl-CoA-carboxylase] ligase [Actinomycetota bacterium]
MAEPTEDELLGAMRAAGVMEAPLRYDAVTESTNATALAWARDGAPEWSLVVAGHQTAGRGRLGRRWVSRPGEALLFSLVLRPDMPPEQALLLTLLAGTAMARACREAGLEVGCKWPNDLLLAEAKIGGILSEAAVSRGRIEHVVLGVGVNIGEAPDVVGAGALQGVRPAPLLAAFLGGFRAVYGSGPAFGGEVLRAYRPLCATLGRRVRATTTDGGTVEGVAVDLDDRGGLVVDTGTGRATVAFGEVRHLR